MTTIQFNRCVKNNMWFNIFVFVISQMFFFWDKEAIAWPLLFVGFACLGNMLYFILTNKDTLNDNEEVPE